MVCSMGNPLFAMRRETRYLERKELIREFRTAVL
jgi:hypothetical protein